MRVKICGDAFVELTISNTIKLVFNVEAIELDYGGIKDDR